MTDNEINIISKRYLKFLAAGGIAALAHWASRIVLSGYVDFFASLVISYVVGLIFAYLLNRKYVFPESELPMKHQVSRFFLINIITMPAVWLTSIGLDHAFYFIDDKLIRQSIAHAFAVMLPAVSSYFFYKVFAFK